jgi:hypothetical protein
MSNVTRKSAAYRRVMNLILSGASGPDVLSTLKVKPSGLKRIMESNRFQELVTLHESVAEYHVRLTASSYAEKALRRLIACLDSGSPEVVRRAATAILSYIQPDAPNPDATPLPAS